MQTVAVLGLGKMGAGIALSLLDKGHSVLVWNRSADKAREIIARGAVWASTPAAAAKNASIIFCMVADDIASTAVWFGAEGAMASIQPGSFAVECSTVSSNHITFIAANARKKNIRFIECPVTGLPDMARTGKLTLLVGADPADLDAVRPVLENISSTIRYFGPVGMGTAYKLIINLMGAVQIAALAEGVAMALNIGLDAETLISAIKVSAAASPQVVRHVRKMALLQFDQDPSFNIALRSKDAGYALALARSIQCATPLGDIATRWFEQSSQTGPLSDEASVVHAVIKAAK